MASSFVLEVLASAGKFEKEELHSNLIKLATKGDELKANVYEFLVGKYAEFNAVYDSTCNLYNQVKSLNEEVDQTTKRIENEMRVRLDASTHEFEELTIELHRCEAIVESLGRLMAAHDYVQKAESSVAAREYTAASDALACLQCILSNVSRGKESNAKVIQALHTEGIVQRESLRHVLVEQWKELIALRSTTSVAQRIRDEAATLSSHTGEMTNTWEVAIVCPQAGSTLSDTLLAMDREGMLDSRLKDLANQMLDKVFHCILTNASSKLAATEDTASQSFILTLTVGTDDPIRKGKLNMRVPDPLAVFGKLERVLVFLHEHLPSPQVWSNGGVSTSCGGSLMRRFGSYIAVPLLESVVRDCLTSAVPRSRRDLDSFKVVANEASRFQAFLVSINFLPSDGSISMLSDYVSNLHVLFANKKCQEILEHARELMKTDLLLMRKHDIACSDVDTTMDDNEQPPGEPEHKYQTLHRNTFQMPRCSLSASALGLMDYAHQMLLEATDSSSDAVSSVQCSAQIFCSVRSIFELYCAVTPVYHRDSLETLPQAAALFYNNSMYLAHEMLTLGHAYRHKWQDPLSADCRMATATFVDLVPKMRALGTGCFMQQLRRQKQQLSDTLNGIKNLDEKAADSVQPCVRQLQHLHNVWSRVLPASSYLKAIGGLVNGVMEEIITSALGLEDITEHTAQQLDSLFETVSSAILPLFCIEEESAASGTKSVAAADAAAMGRLHKHVSRWHRFKELQRLFSASMFDVSERWADGKGPLAAEFSPAEVRQLVRALFQNNERRAAVLAKIK